MDGENDVDLRQEILQLQEKLAVAIADKEKDARTVREIANRLNLFEAMLEIVPVGVVLSDQNGRIIIGNKAVEEMVRHPVLHSGGTESYGEWISFHADGRRVESYEYPLAQVIDGGKERSELSVHYQRGDESKFWMRIIGEPVRDAYGEKIGAVVALIDIDSEYQLTEQQKILIGELNHRVKNAFSVVKSIVSRSLRKEHVPEGLRHTIDQRLDAYATAHAKLVSSDWEHAELSDMVRDIVVKIGGDSIRFSGPDTILPSRQALAISMALYELSTNAVKYGALSVRSGAVDLQWHHEADPENPSLILTWLERGGPAAVSPSEKGFGSFIIDRALAMETGGKVDISYGSEGFEWQLTMPLN